LATSQLAVGTGTAQVNFDGGTLRATGDRADFITSATINAARFVSLRIDSSDETYSPPLSDEIFVRGMAARAAVDGT
jgi:hypothetical protein